MRDDAFDDLTSLGSQGWVDVTGYSTNLKGLEWSCVCHHRTCFFTVEEKSQVWRARGSLRWKILAKDDTCFFF